MTDFEDMPLALDSETPEEDLELGLDDGSVDSGEESTSFDDVALSLLLFFMVMSLFASFQESKEQAQGAAPAKLPAVGGLIDLGEEKERHHVVVTEEEGQFVIVHTDDNGDAGKKVFISPDDKSGRKLKKELLALVESILEEPPEDRNKGGIFLSIQLPTSTSYSRFIPVWYAVTHLHKKNKAFGARVSMVTWGSATLAETDEKG